MPPLCNNTSVLKGSQDVGHSLSLLPMNAVIYLREFLHGMGRVSRFFGRVCIGGAGLLMIGCMLNRPDGRKHIMQPRQDFTLERWS